MTDPTRTAAPVAAASSTATAACRTTGVPCPQCERADLMPYGNGSKWRCPTCFFLAPCCESDLPAR